LGQQSTTLSGGEAQRVKLATELSKKDTGNTFYILDEPTTGLHFEDVNVLLGVLQKLVDKGNSVLIIEHNMDMIKVADYVLDIGPEGGKYGGTLLGAGTPETISKLKNSYTAPFLLKELI
jgi:excinuclease ABC subunit A